MRKVQQDNGYLEIRTHKWLISLWEKSGHAANYADNMFTTIQKTVTMQLNQ